MCRRAHVWKFRISHPGRTASGVHATRVLHVTISYTCPPQVPAAPDLSNVSKMSFPKRSTRQSDTTFSAQKLSWRLRTCGTHQRSPSYWSVSWNLRSRNSLLSSDTAALGRQIQVTPNVKVVELMEAQPCCQECHGDFLNMVLFPTENVSS